MKVKFCVILLLVYSTCFAGGWDNSLIGARSAGLGTAFAGIADNASAIYYNSAGLSFAEARAQFILCGKSLFPTHTYVSPNGEKVTSEIQATLVELFTYYRVNDRWTLGFGMFTPYAGGGVKWPEEEIGYSIEGYIGTIALSPTISLKLFHDLSVGFNVNYYYIVSRQTINDPYGVYIKDRFEMPGDFDPALLKVEDFYLNADEKGTEYAFTGSLFYKPNNKFSFGLTYHGPTNVHLNGTSKIDGNAVYDILPPFLSIPIQMNGSYESSTSFYLPASYALGISYRIKPKLLIAAEYDYYFWSELRYVEKLNSSVPIFIDGIPLEESGMLPDGEESLIWAYQEPLGFNDSYYLKFGAEYLYSERLTLRFGTSYDNGKVSKDAFSFTNIDVTKLNFTAGLGYNLGMFDINFAGFIQIGNEEKVPANPNDETYDLDSVGILASIVSSL